MLAPPLPGSAGSLSASVWSACSVAAEERVKHGQLQALLVSAAPCNHRALAVSRVEVMTVTRERQTERGYRRKRH